MFLFRLYETIGGSLRHFFILSGVKRICSEETDYNNGREDIKDQLIQRGYSKGSIENQLRKMYMLKRENLLQYNPKKQNNRVPLVLT
jgi:AAA15 family ATPase/GTPase